MAVGTVATCKLSVTPTDFLVSYRWGVSTYSYPAEINTVIANGPSLVISDSVYSLLGSGSLACSATMSNASGSKVVTTGTKIYKPVVSTPTPATSPTPTPTLAPTPTTSGSPTPTPTLTPIKVELSLSKRMAGLTPYWDARCIITEGQAPANYIWYVNWESSTGGTSSPTMTTYFSDYLILRLVPGQTSAVFYQKKSNSGNPQAENPYAMFLPMSCTVSIDSGAQRGNYTSAKISALP